MVSWPLAAAGLGMTLQFRNILYPTDFSGLSLEAIDYAVSLAEAFDAQLHCVHVIDEAYQHWISLGPESVPVGPGIEELQPVAQQRLERLAAERLGGLARPVRIEALAGNALLEITDYAQRHEIDLIVMATHGRSGLGHVLLGSLTEKMVRHAPCAVLAVRSRQGRTADGPA